jgi:hypothetical protein
MPNIFKHWKSVGICNGHFSLFGRKMKLYCFFWEDAKISPKKSQNISSQIYIYIRKRRFPQLNLDILSQASKFIGGSHDFPSRSWYPHGTPNGYPSNADVTTRHGATYLDRRGFSDEECCDKKCLRPLWTCLPRRSNWCINI